MNADTLVLPDALMARRFLQGIYAGAPSGLFAAVRMLRVHEENLAPFASSVCAPAEAAEQAAQFVLEQIAHDVDLGIHHSLSLFDAGGTASVNVAWRGVLSVELDRDPAGGGAVDNRAGQLDRAQRRHLDLAGRGGDRQAACLLAAR